jgi:hypothetical protein
MRAGGPVPYRHGNKLGHCAVEVLAFSHFLAHIEVAGQRQVPGCVSIRLVWYDLTHYKTWLTGDLDSLYLARVFNYRNGVPNSTVKLVPCRDKSHN